MEPIDMKFKISHIQRLHPNIPTSQYSDILKPTIPTPQYSDNYIHVCIVYVCINSLSSELTNHNHSLTLP